MKYRNFIFTIIILSIFFSLPTYLLAQIQQERERLNLQEIDAQRQMIQEKRDLLQEQWPIIDKPNIGKEIFDRQIQIRESLVSQFQEEREIFKEYMNGFREDLTSQAKEEIRAKQKQFIEEYRNQINNYKEDFKERIQEMKIQKAKNMNLYKEELRVRLREFLNEEKSDVAEKISDKINNLNEVFSDRYSGRLLAFEIILDKMELRAEMLGLAGKDISDALGAISAARQVIIGAQEKISEQRDKIYKAEFNGEKPPGLLFKELLEELKKDHKELRENVTKPILDSLKICLNILKEIRAQIPEENKEEEVIGEPEQEVEKVEEVDLLETEEIEEINENL